MREIKFRAWDRKNKKWINIQGFNFQNYWIIVWHWVNGKQYFYMPQDVDLLQYTGLKDKNGKEIYEGDILRCNNLYFEVYYDTEMAMFNLKRQEHKITSFLLSATHLYDVAGNIYENPELITEIK